MATLSAKEAARELGTDARNFRKFMRTILDKEDQPGQGNRYHIEEKTIPSLKKQFAEWQKPKAKPTENGVEAEELLEDEFDEDMLLEDDTPDFSTADDEEDITDSVEEPDEDDLEDAEEFDLEEL